MESQTKKFLFRFVLCVSFVFLFSISIVLAPLYSITASNIAYMYTAIPELIELAIKVIEIVSMALCIASVSFLIKKYGAKSGANTSVLYISALFIKCAVDIAIHTLLFKILNVSFAISIISSFFMDLLIFALSILFAYHAHKKNKKLTYAIVKSGIVIALIRIIQRVTFDISYGAPTDLTDLLWMLLYYTADLLFGALFVITALYFIEFIKKKTAE